MTTTRSAPLPPQRPAGAPSGGPAPRRLWLVPVLTAVLTAVLAVAGAGTARHLANGGYTATGTESARAERLLADRYGLGTPDVVLLARARGGVDAPAARAEGLRLVHRLARSPGVASVHAYWTDGDPVLRSADGRRALVAADLAGADRDAARTAKALVPGLTGRHGPLDVSATGPAQVSVEAVATSHRDLVRAELVAAPVTLLLLVVALRSVVAALVPLMIGGVSVVGTLALLRLLALVTPVSVFAVNLTSALGFGLAVDYGLFLVTRYREELRAGHAVTEAVARTARRAGRTVAVSACAVALSMSALLVLPLPFLRSMACAGMAVALFSAAAATAVVPPVLALLGTRVDRGDPLTLLYGLRRGRAVRPPRPDSPVWRAVARHVTGRPLLCGTACAAVLLLSAWPFAHARFALPDERILPAASQAHRTAREIRQAFATPAERTVTVVLPDTDPVRDRAALAAYGRRVAALPSVARVRPVVPVRAHGAILLVTGPAQPQSPAARALVADVRALPAPGGRRLVTGRAALLADTRSAVGARLPLAGAVVAGTTWLMLFLLTRSVLLPVKALVIGALSMGASFGATVLVFQGGHLRGLVGGFTVTGALDLSMPLLMFAIAFGLAIDYEIFLLSRVREQYLRTGDNRLAVVEGVARTGRLVTTGALAVAVVTGALATSGVTVLKLLGTGLATAVLVDAVLVRGVLVPAYLTVAGRANWWLPAWLARPPGARAGALRGRHRAGRRRPGLVGAPRRGRPSPQIVDASTTKR
ncbi:membrane protein [Streptomyces mashuensis]|uniref:Membrane protein n=1 Tax=Streptomyces mashuensis TaxID=33904 RepID=A0A919EAR8_9ACTN|nr:MMPL family transporter [Streptomyces mashuensis]GHF30921.1 membrane protein [Streptomyces mashuensis]